MLHDDMHRYLHVVKWATLLRRRLQPLFPGVKWTSGDPGRTSLKAPLWTKALSASQGKEHSWRGRSLLAQSGRKAIWPKPYLSVHPPTEIAGGKGVASAKTARTLRATPRPPAHCGPHSEGSPISRRPKWSTVTIALAVIAALAIASPVFGLSGSIKKAIRKEVAKQIGTAKGPAGAPGQAFDANATLPSGQTLTGGWGIAGGTGGNAVDSIQFVPRLPADLGWGRSTGHPAPAPRLPRSRSGRAGKLLRLQGRGGQRQLWRSATQRHRRPRRDQGWSPDRVHDERLKATSTGPGRSRLPKRANASARTHSTP